MALTVLAAALLGSGGCGSREPGTTGEGKSNPTGPDDRSIETFVAPLEVAAGQRVEATCVVRRGERHVPDAAVEIEVSPDAGEIVAADGRFVFTPTEVGTYAIHCLTGDGNVRDSRGVHVTVLPAAPASVDTSLSPTLAAAGAPVEVSCAIRDAFENLVEEARATGVEASLEIVVDPPLGAGFIVRGTTTGDFQVACRIDEIVDVTPETLTIVPGIPGRTETTVDVTEIGPNEVVTVSCEVTDAFGNPLSGVDTEFGVMPADGSSPSETGMQQDESTFTVQKAGTYYVFCFVPGFQAGDETPAMVHVKWGLPCTWIFDVEDQTCYWQGRRLPIDVVVYDFWGNEVEDAAIELSATPTTGIVQDSPSSWVFTEEGDFDLSFTVAPPLDDQRCASLSGFAGTSEVLNIRVDSTGPHFDITSPLRADMLELATIVDATITIQGNLTDTISHITSASIIGLDLGADGTQATIPISVGQTSRWGMTIITGTAEDACGNRSVLAQSYLRSGSTAETGYFDASVAPDVGARAPQGIFAQLNQVMIDDCQRGNPLNDLASIGQAILQGQDFNTLVAPGAVFTESYINDDCDWGDFWGPDVEYRVQRDPSASNRITWNGPDIYYLEAVEGGLNIHAGIRNFRFPIRIWARDRECIGVPGAVTIIDIDLLVWAGADSFDIRGPLAVTMVAGQPQVSASGLTVTTSGLDANPSCSSWIDWLCDWVVDLLLPLLEDQVEAALDSAVRAEIPPVIEEMLAGFNLDSGFAIPPPLDMRLEIASGLDWLEFHGPSTGIAPPGNCPLNRITPGHGELGLYAQVYPGARGADIPTTARGAIRKSGVLPSFLDTVGNCSSDPDCASIAACQQYGCDCVSGACLPYALGMGIKDDLFNQILWALWYGGGLDLDSATLADIIGSSGFEGIDMSLFFELPPVVMPGRDGWQIQIGLGDVYVEASVDLAALLGGSSGGGGELRVGLYLSSIMGGSLGINNETNELDVSLDTEPEIWVQVVEIDDPGYQATMSEVFTQLLRLILPNLVSSVLQSFPIPEIDLSGIADLPAGTDATWTFTGAQVEHDQDYFKVVGSLE
ncbi:hypothetical protein ACFL6C_04315 [Myxococcota bacterium]